MDVIYSPQSFAQFPSQSFSYNSGITPQSADNISCRANSSIFRHGNDSGGRSSRSRTTSDGRSGRGRRRNDGALQIVPTNILESLLVSRESVVSCGETHLTQDVGVGCFSESGDDTLSTDSHENRSPHVGRSTESEEDGENGGGGGYRYRQIRCTSSREEILRNEGI